MRFVKDKVSTREYVMHRLILVVKFLSSSYFVIYTSLRISYSIKFRNDSYILFWFRDSWKKNTLKITAELTLVQWILSDLQSAHTGFEKLQAVLAYLKADINVHPDVEKKHSYSIRGKSLFVKNV